MFRSIPDLYWHQEELPPLLWDNPKHLQLLANIPWEQKHPGWEPPPQTAGGGVQRKRVGACEVFMWRRPLSTLVGPEHPPKIGQLHSLQTQRLLEWMSQKKREQNPKSWFNLILLFEHKYYAKVLRTDTKVSKISFRSHLTNIKLSLSGQKWATECSGTAEKGE